MRVGILSANRPGALKAGGGATMPTLMASPLQVLLGTRKWPPVRVRFVFEIQDGPHPVVSNSSVPTTSALIVQHRAICGQRRRIAARILSSSRSRRRKNSSRIAAAWTTRGHARPPLPDQQRLQRVEVAEHRLRLVEGAAPGFPD